MAALGWAADRIGRRPFLVLSGVVFGVGIAGLALAGGYRGLLGVLAVLYAASGLYDVGINASAVDAERRSRRSLMPLFHATFSGSAAAGAVLAGGLLSFGLDYRAVYLTLLAPLFPVLVAVSMTPPPGETRHDPDGTKGTAGYALFRSLPLLLVASIATLGLLAEGEMEHWSGIYLRDALGLPAFLGGTGVAAFYAAMAVGRLATAQVVASFGNRTTLLAAGLLVAVGMASSLATQRSALVVAGFLVVGLALSAVVPVAFSAAGNLFPDRSGAAISVVTTFGYGGFLVGPALVGGLAELTSLRLALGVIALAGLLVSVLSLLLRKS
jgi:MFS family permease